MENILPDKPSELIRLAVEDMKTTIAMGVKINMEMYGSGNRENLQQCSVCFAGAIMLQREDSTINPETFMSHFMSYFTENIPLNKDKYKFLDQIRRGNLEEATEILEIKLFPLKFMGFTSAIDGFIEYENCDNDQQFYDQMEEIAQFFESLKL